MPRSTWSGTISLGLITIPVGLYTAVREQSVGFKQLCPTHTKPIEQRRFCKEGGEEVAYGDLVSGYDLGGGEFVVLTEQDFEQAALPLSRNVELNTFLNEAEVDLRYFNKPYIVLPDKKDPGKSYVLLREALRETCTVGIGMYAARSKQQIAAVRVLGDFLALQTLAWPDELVDLGEFNAPTVAVTPQEVALTTQLIESKPAASADLAALGFRDEYRANLERIIEARMMGEEIAFTAAPEAEATSVDSLLAMLQQSIAQSKAA